MVLRRFAEAKQRLAEEMLIKAKQRQLISR